MEFQGTSEILSCARESQDPELSHDMNLVDIHFLLMHFLCLQFKCSFKDFIFSCKS